MINKALVLGCPGVSLYPECFRQLRNGGGGSSKNKTAKVCNLPCNAWFMGYTSQKESRMFISVKVILGQGPEEG